MIFDAHIHWPIGSRPDATPFMAVLDRYGIDKVILMGWEILFKLGCMAEGNDAMVRFCRQAPDRLIPLGTVHLAEGLRAVEEAKRCIEQLGIKGFKFHPWLQGESMFRPEMDAICELAGQFKTPLVFHDGTPPYALSSQIGLLAKKFPTTIFVLGHSGILHYWQEALGVAQTNPNVLLTLCGPHPLAMQSICDQVDDSRILFGTDYLGPGSEEYVAYRKKMVEGLSLSSERREKVMYQNAQRWFAG